MLTQLHSGMLRRDLCPMAAVVGRDMKQAVIGAGPEHAFLQRRFGEREDGVVIFDAGDVVLDRAAARLLFALVVARQVGADRLPAVTLVGRFEDDFAAGVDACPDRAARAGKGETHWKRCFRSSAPWPELSSGQTLMSWVCFLRLIVAGDVAFVVGVDDVPVARIGNDEAASRRRRP